MNFGKHLFRLFSSAASSSRSRLLLLGGGSAAVLAASSPFALRSVVHPEVEWKTNMDVSSELMTRGIWGIDARKKVEEILSKEDMVIVTRAKNPKSFVSGTLQTVIGIITMKPKDPNLPPTEARTKSLVYFGSATQGPPESVHGGCLATICDSSQGACLYAHKLPSVTLNLNINYRKFVPVESAVLVTTNVDKIEGRKIYLTTKITSLDETIIHVESQGLWLLFKKPENE